MTPMPPVGIESNGKMLYFNPEHIVAIEVRRMVYPSVPSGNSVYPPRNVTRTKVYLLGGHILEVDGDQSGVLFVNRL